ncbi:hypothetical protein [Clostridium sp. MD294]|uniref:hypothetical protein n=1 Tax=Clostridium sp. MD294 TaxID=97138 RepID=UPI0002C913C2|nr:hypothetical protein [Clostridium sp. MD294]USF30967.1 hypothetical protein C820_002412 [Clostridium sp. MD294]
MVVLNCISILFYIDYMIYITKDILYNFNNRLPLQYKKNHIRLILFIVGYSIASIQIKTILFIILILYVFLLCFYINKKSKQQQIQHLYINEIKHLIIISVIMSMLFIIFYHIFHNILS